MAHKINTTLSVPQDRSLTLVMSVLLGPFCPVGRGARAIWQFRDVAKTCIFTLHYLADGDPEEPPTYDDAHRMISTSWNPIRMVFKGSKVTVSNADDDEKSVELRCSFPYTRNNGDTIYDIIVNQAAPEGACMGTMHIPNWMEANVRRTRDGFLHAMQSIPDNSPHFARDDVWLPRAEKYIEDTEMLLGEEYDLGRSRIPHRISGDLTTTLRVAHGRKLMFVLLPLEGRTCVKGHASRIIIFDIVSGCRLRVTISVTDDKEKMANVNESEVKVPWMPLRLEFDGANFEASDAKGHRVVRQMSCPFKSEKAAGRNVYHLDFRRARIDAIDEECSSILLTPSYIGLDATEGRQEEGRKYHSEL